MTMTLVYRLIPPQPGASRGKQQMTSASLGHQTPEDEELTTPQASTAGDLLSHSVTDSLKSQTAPRPGHTESQTESDGASLSH